MPLKLLRSGIVLFALALGFAVLFPASKAEAQTTNCMAMGGGMAHCTTMGSSGGMSNTDCMAMGPDMATCNTIGGGGSTSGGAVGSPVDLYRMLFGDKTRKQIGKLLAQGDCEGAAKYAFDHNRLEFGLKIQQSCRSSDARTYTALSRAPASGKGLAPAQQAPGTLYETVDYLARNASVPFTADTQAGTVAVTKIEAFNTQLRMNVQVNDPQATLAAMAAPANLQVICADPNFSKVLRLGGSIRLTFVRKSGAMLGTATETGQLCGY